MTKRGHETPHLDVGRYPRTYTFSRPTRWILVSVGLLLCAGCLTGAFYFGWIADMPANGRFVAVGIFAAFTALGLYLAAGARFYRVILSPDSIDVFEVPRRRRLERADIAGRQRLVNQIGAGWTLVPKAGLGRQLQLSSFLKTDKDFSDWMLSLPDLDKDRTAAADREAAAAMESLVARGYGPKTKHELRQLATWFNRAAIGVVIGAYLLPDPYHVLTWVCIALPWVAVGLVARFQPFYRFGGPKNGPLPDLSLGLIGPGCVLVLLALTSIATVEWRGPLILSIGFCLVLMAAALLADPRLRRHRGTAALVAVLVGGYGYGAGLEVNALLDRSTPINYPVVVSSKRVSQGKSTSYHLGVPPWGPYHTSDEVMVSGWRYRQTHVGDTVCLLLRPGALRVPWYTVASCDDVQSRDRPVKSQPK